MNPGPLSQRIVSDRLSWVERMVGEIQALPLNDRDAFFADHRNIWTAESCLRRALEALLDLGRHVLAKGFGIAVTEYRDIAVQLQAQGVLSPADGDLLRVLAGYRNRLVHFYHEIDATELYDICIHHLNDLEQLCAAYRKWLRTHPELLDKKL